MLDLQTLKTELVTDPVGRGYSGMSASAAAASLMSVDRQVRRLVPNWQLKQTVIEIGVWGPVVLIAAGTLPPAMQALPEADQFAIRALCVSVRDWIDDRTGQIQHTDMGLPSTQSMLAGLVAAGLVTSPQAAGLDALADATISRAEELGLGVVEARDVRDARSLA